MVNLLYCDARVLPWIRLRGQNEWIMRRAINQYTPPPISATVVSFFVGSTGESFLVLWNFSFFSFCQAASNNKGNFCAKNVTVSLVTVRKQPRLSSAPQKHAGPGDHSTTAAVFLRADQVECASSLHCRLKLNLDEFAKFRPKKTLERTA